MRYMGSKNRISKELKIIIENYITDTTESYIEPFVGGANMIDKIQFKNKIGYDIHKELIALLNYVKDEKNILPETFTEEEFNKVKKNRKDYEDWYVGLVGFCGSFGSNYFGGFARSYRDGVLLDVPITAIRNIQKQRPNLKNITFINDSYLNIDVKNSLIYCDPPYKGTSKYKDIINYDEFYEWCIKMVKNGNTVLVSEYNIEHKNFKEIWNKEVKCNINNQILNRETKRIEKLYKVEL